MDVNIFAHLFQKCEDSLDLTLGVFHLALCLIDVIQNCPVCKEAVKEEIRKFQKAVHRNLKVCGDFNIGKFSFEPPQFHLELFDLFLCIVQFLILGKIGHQTVYAGIEWEAGTPEAEKFYRFLHDEMGVAKVRFPESSSFGVKPVSKEGTERLVRAACKYALEHGLPSVTLVHKGNIMKFTEGGFKKWGYELAEREFGDAIASGKLVIKDCIADAFLQNTLLIPEEYSVVATLNLNGDYISDQLAAMVGGIGIAPGANINYNTGHAIFEATHGTAPNIAGKDVVNPCSLILSAVMMLEHFGWNKAAELIVNALESSFGEGRATHDLARFMPGGVSLGTSAFTKEIIERINS